jgi:hypothetical protein
MAKLDFSAGSESKRITRVEQAVALLIQRELDFGARYVKYWYSNERADFAMITGFTNFQRQLPSRKGVEKVMAANLIVFSSKYSGGIYPVTNAEPFIYEPGVPDEEQKREGKYEPWHPLEASEKLKEIFDKIEGKHEADTLEPAAAA